MKQLKLLYRVVGYLTFLILFAINSLVYAQNINKTDGAWISLFNGKNFEGWTPKFTGSEAGVNYKNTYRVENGILKVSYDDYEKFNGEFGHLFYKDKFSHYMLRLEYRFVGGQASDGPNWAFRNSGIMIHSQPPEEMRLDQEFPVSVEIQLLGGNGTDPRPTANICTPGTHVVIADTLVKQHCISSSSETYHGNQWVTAMIEVRGNEIIRHFVNGELVFEYKNPQLDESDPDAKKLLNRGADKMLKEGYICLQAESHPVEFRNIKIRLLN